MNSFDRFQIASATGALNELRNHGIYATYFCEDFCYIPKAQIERRGDFVKQCFAKYGFSVNFRDLHGVFCRVGITLADNDNGVSHEN